MNRIAALLAIVLLIVGCCSMPHSIVASKSLIDKLENSTAVLVYSKSSFDWKLRPFCSGVWLSPTLLLTAHHCVEGESSFDVWTRQDLGDKSPSEMVESTAAYLEKDDAINDLALLRVRLAGHHSWVRLATRDPAIGDILHVVGHTAGLTFSYTPAFVGSIRRMKNAQEQMSRLVQVFSAATHGNSGGGAFNEVGELVSICSFGIESTALSFFVHVSLIRELLVGVPLD